MAIETTNTSIYYCSDCMTKPTQFGDEPEKIANKIANSFSFLFMIFGQRLYMIQGIFACSVRRVKRFWHILLLDDSAKNVKDVSLFSDNLYILFINNCLYIFINSILMRLKSHYCSLVIASLFIGT